MKNHGVKIYKDLRLMVIRFNRGDVMTIYEMAV